MCDELTTIPPISTLITVRKRESAKRQRKASEPDGPKETVRQREREERVRVRA